MRGARNEDWFVNLLSSAQKKLDTLLDAGSTSRDKRGTVRGEVYDTFLKKLAHPSNALVYEAMKVGEAAFLSARWNTFLMRGGTGVCADVCWQLHRGPVCRRHQSELSGGAAVCVSHISFSSPFALRFGCACISWKCGSHLERLR